MLLREVGDICARGGVGGVRALHLLVLTRSGRQPGLAADTGTPEPLLLDSNPQPCNLLAVCLWTGL